MSWKRFTQQDPCPVCNGQRKDCRQSLETNLIHCFASAVDPVDHIFRGQDALGFGMWADKADVEQWEDRSREEWQQEQQAKQEARERERQEGFAKSLTEEERDRDIQAILGQLTLTESDRLLLKQRGLDDLTIDLVGYRSVEQWHPLNGNLRYGVNSRGNLNNPCAGILCPIRNAQGQLIALRLHNPNAASNDLAKYLSFKGSNLKSGEFPIAVYGQDLARGTVGLTEGLEFKPAIASLRLGIPVIGANGVNHASSPKQLKESLEALGTQQVIFYPDGGMLTNHDVISQYKKTFRLLQSWGYVVQVAWWGQVEKINGDIDEIGLDEISKIQHLTVEQFLALCPPPPKIGEFRDWIFSKLKRHKSLGFSKVEIPQLKKVKFIDADLEPLPSFAEWQTKGRPEIRFSGDRAGLITQLVELGYSVIHDASFMGDGKSHSVPELIQIGSKTWYLSSDHRNPSVKAIEEQFTDLMPRSQLGFYRDEDGKLKPAKVDTPKESLEIEGNCIRTDLFNQLGNMGYNPSEKEGKLNPICATCPLSQTCIFQEELYRSERKTTLSQSLIRGDIQSLPGEEHDYRTDTVILDELNQISATKIITSDYNGILHEVDHLRREGNLNPENKDYLNSLLDALHALSKSAETRDEKRFGWTHLAILKALPQLSDENLAHIIKALETHPIAWSDVFKEVNRLGTQADLNTQAQLDRIPPNALIYLLKAIRGDLGIALRQQEETLIITLDNRSSYSPILNQAGSVIIFDGTATTEKVQRITGIQKPIVTISKKLDRPLKNLKVINVQVAGLKTNHPTDTAIERVKAIVQTIGEAPVIGHKSMLEALDINGYWFKDNRGVNSFEGEPILVYVGTPYPNVGAIQDQYFALTETLDGFNDDYLSLVRDEILQGTGRQRVGRYPDREFTLYCLMTDQDLDWLSHYGATVMIRDAFEVTPEAGTQTQAARFRLLNTVQSILLAGQKITQAAIAKVIDISQQAVSKLLNKAGLTLSELVKLAEKILSEKNTTASIESSYRDGCIPERLYNDPTVRDWLDLPPLELMTMILEAIADLGWADFKLLLFDIFPEPLQAKILGALWTGFEMDVLPAPE